jgi:hypothetical protein
VTERGTWVALAQRFAEEVARSVTDPDPGRRVEADRRAEDFAEAAFRARDREAVRVPHEEDDDAP